MSASSPHLASDYIARQRVLVDRVQSLWVRGILTGEMLVQAREADLVFTSDFVEESFTVSLHPRHHFAEVVPDNCTDEYWLAMCKGQPPQAVGEDVATWFVAAEWAGDKPVVEVHGPLRAWRDLTAHSGGAR